MSNPHDPNATADIPASSVPPDSLDAGLVAGFGRPMAPRSSLGDLRPVLLREAEGESAHIVKPKSDAMPPKDETGDRYQLSGEIARGGMGAVLRGRDVDLGRDLAIKVLLEKYADRPEVARRFIEEAQIGGQLQHPGVVPVYDIGKFGNRPFFTMKLVKGQTLAQILSEREQPTDDRPRLLGIALKVSEALAYAHAKGVIHRDLKPANVMVGAFGEVQVMDWGLAKVLAEGGIADEQRAGRAHQEREDVTTIRTARSLGSAGSCGSDTEAGSLLGTPAYMPPEQANGDIANLDRRADVFGLGAILCEILTGKPPYVGRSGEEVRRKAANGDLADATARLDACGEDVELITLTKACLSPEAIDRPKDAQEVVDGLSAYLNGVQERLQTAQRERAVAVAREAEQRKKRRVVQAAGGLIALVLLAGLGVSLWQMSVAGRERDAKAKALDAETAERERAEKAEKQANAERDAKAQALSAEQKAREQTLTASRSMTSEVVDQRLASRQGHRLTDEDRAFLRAIAKQWEAVAALRGEDADSRSVRAEGRYRVSQMRSNLGEWKEAEADIDAALAIFEQLAADFPNRPEFRAKLAACRNSRGLLLQSTGRLKGAEADHAAALALQKQLAADFPTSPEYRQSLAMSHHNRGMLLRATGRPKEAEANYDAALAIYKQLVAEFPTNPEFREFLATSHHNRASLNAQQGNLAGAKRQLQEGRPHHLAALKANPRHPTYRQFYRNHLWLLMVVHAGLLEPDEAVRTAETRRDLGWDPPADAYDTACGRSRCIPIVSKHEKLDDAQRKEEAKFYGDAAMKMLHDAVTKGWKDAARMKKDNDLDPLRDRDDFKKLLAELEKK